MNNETFLSFYLEGDVDPNTSAAKQIINCGYSHACYHYEPCCVTF